MRPNGFDAFTVGQSNTIHQGEVVWNLTTVTMPDEVELQYADAEGGKGFEIKVEWWGVVFETTVEIYSPLTPNIVCDQELTEPFLYILLNGRRKGIVGVDVPFPTLEVCGAVGSNQRMPA